MLHLNISHKESLLLNKLTVAVLDSIFNLLTFKNRMGYHTSKLFLLILTSRLATLKSHQQTRKSTSLKAMAQTVTGLSPWRPSFYLRSVYVEFVVNKVALGQVTFKQWVTKENSSTMVYLNNKMDRCNKKGCLGVNKPKWNHNPVTDYKAHLV
jgi:hypothetical protein